MLFVKPEDVLEGNVTDKYFIWTEKILKKKGINPEVVSEVTAREWGIFSGLDDVLNLLEGKKVDVYAMPEGTLFYPNEPVMFIVGKYLEFAKLETSILGFLCHSSGVSKAAFKAKFAAGDRTILSFGTRRQHPSIAAMIERAAYIGGVDGVSNYIAEKYLGIKSIGTMPHALIICFGNQVEAWKAFDDVVDKEVPRIMLIDTYCDEKSEAIMAIENVGRVDGVRLDTPSSRRGNIRAIVEEIRWELSLRGRDDVKIVLSGGISVEDIKELRDLVDAFGVGTYIACARPIDFAMDIVEKEGEAVAKRGKLGGKKAVLRDWSNLVDKIVRWENTNRENLLVKVIEDGKVINREVCDLEKARERVLKQMKIAKSVKVKELIEKFRYNTDKQILRGLWCTDLFTD